MKQSTQNISTTDQTTRSEIERIVLESDVNIHFEPVMSLDSNQVVGCKAVPKGPVGTALENSLNLRSAAQKYELVDELDYAVLAKALGMQHELPEGQFLSISVGSDLFLSSLFREITNLCQHIAPQIIFELTENIPFVELAFMQKRINELQELGYQIALNNTESIFSGFERAKRLKPTIIKVCLITLQRLTENNVELTRFRNTFRDLQAQSISLQADGIVNAQQASELLELGFTLGQGKLSAIAS